MNRDTARAILAAAALMTVQALLLAVLATSAAHASTVYRCPAPSADGAVIYQAQPCAAASGVPVRTADARTREQQSQANANHARQVAWLDRHQPQASSPKTSSRTAAKKRRGNRKAQAAGAQGAPLAAAVPLSSHRIGQRPFERLGQEVTSPDRAVNKPKKPKRSPYELLARTPSTGKAQQQASNGNVRPSP